MNSEEEKHNATKEIQELLRTSSSDSEKFSARDNYVDFVAGPKVHPVGDIEVERIGKKRLAKKKKQQENLQKSTEKRQDYSKNGARFFSGPSEDEFVAPKIQDLNNWKRAISAHIQKIKGQYQFPEKSQGLSQVDILGLESNLGSYKQKQLEDKLQIEKEQDEARFTVLIQNIKEAKNATELLGILETEALKAAYYINHKEVCGEVVVTAVYGRYGVFIKDVMPIIHVTYQDNFSDVLGPTLSLP